MLTHFSSVLTTASSWSKTMRHAVLLLSVLFIWLANSTSHAKDAEPWPFWETHNASSTATIDHSAWDALLKTYIRADNDLNRFAYGRVSASDRQALNDYLQLLQRTNIRDYARTEQKAFWTNLYNALTIQVILDHYPVESIRDIDISPGLFSDGPWGKKLVRVAGQELSLDDIEHRILRPIWDTPLTHYTVNCASVGCPNLAKQAFTGANIAELQERLAREYVNSSRGVLVKDGRITVSKIYDWFDRDFGGSEAAILAHLKQYAQPSLVKQLKTINEIDDYDYGWSLNE